MRRNICKFRCSYELKRCEIKYWVNDGKLKIDVIIILQCGTHILLKGPQSNLITDPGLLLFSIWHGSSMISPIGENNILLEEKKGI